MSTAWHIAALSRVKKLPKLEKLLIREPKKPASQEEIHRKIRWINAMFGGDMRKKS